MKSASVNTWDIVRLLCAVNILMQIFLVLFSGVDIRSYLNGVCLGVTAMNIMIGYVIGGFGGSNDE